MDWLEIFKEKYSQYSELKDLKQNHFHGSIEIFFADGIPHSCQLHRNFRGIKIEEKKDE